MEKVGVRISARIRQHKQPTDTTIKVKPYVMGPEKAMNKKEDSCDRNMSSISVANSVPYVIPTTTSSNFSTACLTSTLHQIQSTSSCNTTNTTSVSSGAISSIISPIKSKKKAPNKLMVENDNLRSFIIELEQKINDQERTINLLKSAKPSNEYTSTQNFTNNQNNMNGLPNSGYKENMDNIEKKLATLMDYQHMLAFSNLNSRIDNLQNTMMNNPHTPFSTVQNPYAPSFPIRTHFQHNVHPHSILSSWKQLNRSF
ncbi:unnamed protein product [Mytilus edulis]|uniref:Uncharacterized protein n=1 Tax=Mytilus edulis TaxID=6550 RepID=A0A8S3QM49_MYTED|nr:unnamed protein product [Mytilus edulis]